MTAKTAAKAVAAVIAMSDGGGSKSNSDGGGNGKGSGDNDDNGGDGGCGGETEKAAAAKAMATVAAGGGGDSAERQRRRRQKQQQREGRMILLASGEEEERTCVGRSTGRPSIVPASDDHCHRLSGWRLDNQRQPREEEVDNFVGPVGGADKAMVAPRPGVDGTTSNRTADKANEGAKEKTEERRIGVIWDDEERRLVAARAGGSVCVCN